MANQQRKRPLSEQDAYAAALSMILGHGDRPGRLDLSGLGLSELPAEIGRLTRLSMLNLGDNQLVELPAEIGRLAGLEELYLDGNLLAELPAQIGGLRQLKFLRLARNRLTSLVPEIGQLHNLHELVLDGNRLTALPPEVGQLAELLWLNLEGNRLTRLPEQVGNLRKLGLLDLDGNLLTELPAQIGRLTEVHDLRLRGNRLTQLPPEAHEIVGRMTGLRENPLREPLGTLCADHPAYVPTFLQSLVGAALRYEAKALLVGEGNVGKTSLVAALLGKPFIVDRPTTHGIQLETLSLRHPRLDAGMLLNTWDFGGQVVYRITHQFFFSRHALYLLVWRPREGHEENAIEGWLRRIRLRVGQDARVMVIATHCDERAPELDFPGLEREFGDMLVDQYAVDNRSGTGVEKLRYAIADQAARLPQMGQRMNSRWLAARDEALSLDAPQIFYHELVAVCRRHGLEDAEIHTLSNVLHELGHIIHYAEDEGLRDIVVLNPEWLTKAISHVLEDRPTRQAGGVLDHARLKKIWEDSEYPAEYHPYFLRLMEKFDVCYRLPDDATASLVGQLVPYARPGLPWDARPEPRTVRTLALLCEMSEPAPGMVPWLIVRHHRFWTRLHWRTGVFLADPTYDSEALFELVDDQHLSLEVRAPSPDLFFSILRDGLEHLVALRWPGLSYELLIPCHSTMADGTPCAGRFKYRSLLGFRERGVFQIPCDECFQMQEVVKLLTGFELPEIPQLPARLERALDGLSRGQRRVELEVRELRGIAAEQANHVRRLLRAIGADAVDCPRLFTLAARPPSRWSRPTFWQNRYWLTLWCEQPGGWHVCREASYELDLPKEWAQRVAPYIRVVSLALSHVFPVAAAIGDAVERRRHEEMRRSLDLMEKFAQQGPPVQEDPTSPPARLAGGLTRAEGSALRAFREMLFELDPPKAFGGLRRVQDPTGDFIWLCPTHYPQWDPGLPEIPP